MRKCHIDKNFNFYQEEEAEFGNAHVKNTLNCDDKLYEAIVAMETLYNCAGALKLSDIITDDFHDVYNRLKAKVLTDEIQRLREPKHKSDLKPYESTRP